MFTKKCAKHILNAASKTMNHVSINIDKKSGFNATRNLQNFLDLLCNK